MAECAHFWIPNSGNGGEPVFKLNRQMSPEPLMHVRCSKCGSRTWFTEVQWRAIPATLPPSTVRRDDGDDAFIASMAIAIPALNTERAPEAAPFVGGGGETSGAGAGGSWEEPSSAPDSSSSLDNSSSGGNE